MPPAAIPALNPAEKSGIIRITETTEWAGQADREERAERLHRLTSLKPADRPEAWKKERKPMKKKTAKLEIYIQSPLGGNITPEEIEARMPEGAESCFVRVDQNLIWWVRGEETGAIEIWSDDR